MIFLILLFSVCSSFAQVVFTPHEPRQYFPGDFVSGTLSFNTKVEGEIIQLKGKNLLGNFFISELEISGNGQANIILVPLVFFDTQKKLSWFGESVDFSALRLGESTIQPKSFIIFEHSLHLSFFEKYWLWLTIFLILTIIGLLLWKIRKNKISLRYLMLGKEKKIAFWREKIIQASKRSDFEMIYQKRKEWMPLIAENDSKTGNFFEVLNKHQYKKDWNEVEYKEVEESYLRFKDGI